MYKTSLIVLKYFNLVFSFLKNNNKFVFLVQMITLSFTSWLAKAVFRSVWKRS
jgi:hypothetical protein